MSVVGFEVGEVRVCEVVGGLDLYRVCRGVRGAGDGVYGLQFGAGGLGRGWEKWMVWGLGVSGRGSK